MAEHKPRVSHLPEKHLQTRCGLMISGPSLMSYRCELAIGHADVPVEDPEPHYAPEVDRTVRAWQEWQWRQENPAPEPEPHVATVKGADKPLSEVIEEAISDHPALEDTAYDADAHLSDEEVALAQRILAPGDDDDRTLGEIRREALRTREGDQRLPDGDESLVDDQSLLIADIDARRQVGIQRYGQGHRPFNGRDTLKDWYEEQLDGLVYARSILRMAEASREDLIEETAKVLRHIEEDVLPAKGVEAITHEAVATEIVGRIMGWVASQIIGNGTGISDEVLESLIVDGIHEGIHAEITWGEVAGHIVEKVKRERDIE